MESAGGDPKTAAPGAPAAQKAAVPGAPVAQKTAVPGDNGRESDSKRDSGPPSAESRARSGPLRADAPAFIPQSRVPPATPSPPRAPTQAPAATGGFRTPNPSPSPPAPRSTGSSGSSSGPQPRPQQPPMQGFAAAAKLGRAAKLEMENRKKQLLQYLNRDDCDYGAQAQNLGRKLTVDFEDLLQKNRELAIQICQDRCSNATWLNDACKAFFESKGLPSDRVIFDFENIPSRLEEAAVFMQSKDCTKRRAICSNTSSVVTATHHGREVTDLIINRVLDDVADKGLSWDGKLGLGDILFGETADGKMKVYIAKMPVYNSHAPEQARLDDLKSIWTMIEEGCKLVGSNLPLYFSELQSDLQKAKDLSDWFIKYLRFHPALYASTPQRYFVTSLQQITRRKGLVHGRKYKSLFTMAPLTQDWRLTIAATGPLNKLLNFQSQSGTQQASKDNSKKQRNQKDQYKNNYGSLLDFVKNGLSHLSQYINVMDDDEIELFLALSFPKFLPEIMKGILERSGMGGNSLGCIPQDEVNEVGQAPGGVGPALVTLVVRTQICRRLSRTTDSKAKCRQHRLIDLFNCVKSR